MQGLQKAHDKLVAQLGAANPQTQATTFWLAAALIDAHSIDATSKLVDGLDAKALESVQTDGLWPRRLDLLRGLILAQRSDASGAAPLLRKSADGLAGHDPSDSRLIEQANAALGKRN